MKISHPLDAVTTTSLVVVPVGAVLLLPGGVGGLLLVAHWWGGTSAGNVRTPRAPAKQIPALRSFLLANLTLGWCLVGHPPPGALLSFVEGPANHLQL